MHGGVAADLDVASVRPIDPLLRGCGGLVALLSDDLAFPRNVPAALLAGAPGHPLFAEALHAVHAATRGGRRALPRDVDASVVIKAAAARLLTAHDAGGGSASAKAAARAARLDSAAAIRAHAARRVLAVRVPGLCVAPAGALYPYDWHVHALRGERVDADEERALARSCGALSPDFDADACRHLLGVAGAAAYTVAHWSDVPRGAAAATPRRGWLAALLGRGGGLGGGGGGGVGDVVLGGDGALGDDFSIGGGSGAGGFIGFVGGGSGGGGGWLSFALRWLLRLGGAALFAAVALVLYGAYLSGDLGGGRRRRGAGAGGGGGAGSVSGGAAANADSVRARRRARRRHFNDGDDSDDEL